MRPLYLEINSFGPYAGREALDFRLLEDRSLFLICGPTGAGKTTVLDAMCYALYNDTSGVRTGAHMRSEYASPQEVTSVSFRFAVGEKCYRVERQPEQEVAKSAAKECAGCRLRRLYMRRTVTAGIFASLLQRT